jgi:hypothetical protein
MPVLVDENGVVIAGHARLGAAAKLKLTKPNPFSRGTGRCYGAGDEEKWQLRRCI